MRVLFADAIETPPHSRRHSPRCSQLARGSALSDREVDSARRARVRIERRISDSRRGFGTTEIYVSGNQPRRTESAPSSGQLVAPALRSHARWWRSVDDCRHRAKAAGIETDVSPHSSRVTGFTIFQPNGDTPNTAQQPAAHADEKTTQLYDRHFDLLDHTEAERIRLRGRSPGTFVF